MSDKFSTRLVSEIDSKNPAEHKVITKTFTQSVPNIVRSVKSKALSSLSFQDNFPFISEIAALTPEAMFKLAENSDIGRKLLIESGDFCAFLRETEHSSANHAFSHFIGNLSHSFQILFRNSDTRNKYSGLIGDIPSYARALHIIATKEPKHTYFRILSESETRIANNDFSPPDWLASVRRIIS